MFESLAVDPKTAAAIDLAVQENRLSHALILEGSDERTRLAAAKEIACALVCESGGHKPCGVCAKCRKAQADSHPDLYLIEPEKAGAFIKVDAIRTLKAQSMLRPNDGERSVFHIREAQMMNVQAQNALLKILEEPAAHVSILLSCPSKAALLETILSRATAFPLQNEAAADLPLEEAQKTAETLLQTLADGSELDLLLSLAPLQKDRVLFSAVLSACRLILRDALVETAAGKPLRETDKTVFSLRRRLTQKQLLALMDETQSELDALSRNANLNLILTCFCSGASGIRHS